MDSETQVSSAIFVTVGVARDGENAPRLSLCTRSDEGGQGDGAFVWVATLPNIPGNAVEEPQVFGRVEDALERVLDKATMCRSE